MGSQRVGHDRATNTFTFLSYTLGRMRFIKCNWFFTVIQGGARQQRLQATVIQCCGLLTGLLASVSVLLLPKACPLQQQAWSFKSVNHIKPPCLSSSPFQQEKIQMPYDTYKSHHVLHLLPLRSSVLPHCVLTTLQPHSYPLLSAHQCPSCLKLFAFAPSTYVSL